MGAELVVVPKVRPGVVTDPMEIAEIAGRVEFYSRPWWRRIGRRPQPRWTPSMIHMSVVALPRGSAA
jgi:hypothetical protein